ncbi:hypothetical protein KCP69_06215 [Salmonella enterica subsp. enterica]|nr:hypothetical protein KCP69_06215 [Salmonella enterica subsp. enterica]
MVLRGLHFCTPSGIAASCRRRGAVAANTSAKLFPTLPKTTIEWGDPVPRWLSKASARSKTLRTAPEGKTLLSACSLAGASGAAAG